MTSRLAIGLTALAALTVLVAWEGSARADLMLTQAGRDRGLSLSTFATGFPNAFNVGPLGIVFPASGGVLVSDLPGNVRRFPTDTDGQTIANATLGQSYGSDNAQGLARVGNNIYMTQRGSLSRVIQVNDNGTFQRVIVGGIPEALGIVTNPTNGHLIVSTGGTNQLWDVNPVALTKTLFGNVSFDGMTTDGTVLYGATDSGPLNGHLLGFRLSDKQLVFDSGFIPGGIDGSALGASFLSGNIYANTNAGTLVEVNLTTKVQTLIATGGSRGDFVTVDPTNGTLLLTEKDLIIRVNGTFQVNDGQPIPEPGTLLLLGLGTFGLLLRSRRAHPTPAGEDAEA